MVNSRSVHLINFGGGGQVIALKSATALILDRSLQAKRMKRKLKYRTNGAIGALLDEYEKSLNELIAVINNVSEEDLMKIVDSNTEDEDCKSIQTILSHVVQSGYTYVVEIRKWIGEKVEYKNKELLPDVVEYENALKKMFQYNERLFEDYPNVELCEYENNKKINVRWGQQYDVEQLFEHAIVHILRHRRQIERFKEKLKASREQCI